MTNTLISATSAATIRFWGFGQIYIVNPADRSVVEWKDGSMITSNTLAGIPVERIWTALDAQYGA
jgi:hypothetical protein